MSDEPHNENLLVDQNEALDFYFDSLLLPDDNDQQTDDSEQQLDIVETNEADKQSSQKDVKKISSQVPVTSEPGKTEFRDVDIVSKKNQSNSSIVFSNKNNDGEVSEQVLIPRSRRLASLKKTTQSSYVSKSISKEKTKTVVEPLSIIANRSAANNISTAQNMPLKKESVSKSKTKSTQEAPKLDLSLFLPKIKTLSDAEITQQMESLAQTAVIQAQKEQLTQQVIKTQAEAGDGLIRNIDNAPSWAVPDFQVLLFAVAGLKLAVPLNELNGIVEWGDEYITELPGHKSWYLGIIQNQGKNVPVIDTLQQVVPENRWPAAHVNEKNFKHIILIDNKRWGLACETVLEVVTLKTDSVKWRSSRTKRRWLLGTVIEHMCALLDSYEFAAMLKTGDDSLLS